MKRRGAAALTGLGNNSEFMNCQSSGSKNKDKIINKSAKDCYKIFFKGTEMDFNYCDAEYKEYEVRLGVEPTYMYQRLKMIVIDSHKELSYMVTGYAYGPWGTGIRSNKKYYKQYKNKSKFVKFVDNWHNKIFNCA